ncbi:MAG: hypothetical protein JWO38_7122 [Gemmataceae bacterium]|nr:hypothetical protein [Gemmataceae bacterium]
MISGKYLQVTLSNGIIVSGVQEWRARETVDKLDAQTAVHLGFYANQQGCQLLSVDITLVQDISNGIYTMVSANSTLTNLALWRSYQDTIGGILHPAFLIPVFNVFESDNGSAIKDRFTVKFSGEAYGPYQRFDPGN